MVYGLGFRDLVTQLELEGLGFMVYGLGFRDLVTQLELEGLGFMVYYFETLLHSSSLRV